MVQKRVANVEPTLREKLCATCGRPFQLTPDQKFYLCPNCYRKAQPPPKRPPRKGEAQVLIQIHCLECGVEEYLDFVPFGSECDLLSGLLLQAPAGTEGFRVAPLARPRSEFMSMKCLLAIPVA